MRRDAYYMSENEDGEKLVRLGYLVGFTRDESGKPLAIFEYERIGRMELMAIDEVVLLKDSE